MYLLRKIAVVGVSASKSKFHWSCILLSNRGPLVHPGWYPRDHQPGLYPTTEAERRAAAIKYGLRPEDYKPISPDSLNHRGDYPDLGHIAFPDRDPYENIAGYAIQNRNWGEPVPVDSVVYTRDRRPDSSLDDTDFTLWRILKEMSKVWLFFAGVALVMYSQVSYLKFHYKILIMPKQYPYDFKRAYPMDSMYQYPITNYTFEPETEPEPKH